MLEIGLSHYLTVAAILFTLGIFGIFLNRKNVIIILMSIELILLAVNINLVSFSVFLHDLLAAWLLIYQTFLHFLHSAPKRHSNLEVLRYSEHKNLLGIKSKPIERQS
mgnify:CR=1 FL=1